MTEFRVWRDELGGKYDVNGTGDLIKKLTCSLNLPKGCIGKGTRTNKGARTMFNLENLRKHYQIGVCMIDLSSQAAGGNGSGSDSDVEEEMICNIGEDTTTEEDENEDKIADAAATTEEVLDDTNSVEVRCGNGKVIRVKKQKKNW
jgi:hypothetical protein